MSHAVLDLLGWTAIFVGLFFLFRHLQKRKKGKNKDE